MKQLIAYIGLDVAEETPGLGRGAQCITSCWRDCIDPAGKVEAATARRDRLEAHIAAALPDWSLAMVVHALQALRGMALVAAATLVAELGDITRFANPRQLMAYLWPGAVRALHEQHTDAKAVSQRLATVQRGGCSSRLPGAIGSRRGSAASSCYGRECQASRSAIPRGRHRNDCPGGIASLHGQVSRRPSSPPRSHASWQASSGQSPDRRSPPTLDVLMLAEHEARRSHRTNTHPKLGKAGGTSRSRRTLASTTSRISSDAGR